jgi:N-acetylmuramoyl-L-alanine amidase
VSQVSFRNTAELKRSILREVYEDNLGIAAPPRRRVPWRRDVPAQPEKRGARGMLMVAALLVTVVGAWLYQDLATTREARIALVGEAWPSIGVLAEESAARPVDPSSDDEVSQSVPADPILESAGVDHLPQTALIACQSSPLRLRSPLLAFGGVASSPRSGPVAPATLPDHGTRASCQTQAGAPSFRAGIFSQALSTPADYGALIQDAQVPIVDLFGLGIRTIVLDPGHGGGDPGAMGPTGVMEKDVTLDIAKRLRERLSKYDDYRVLLTREKDVRVSLRDRVEFSNSSGADLFISIHVNSLPLETLAIVETYFFGPHDDEVSLRVAHRENQGSGYGMGDFKAMIEKIGNTLKTQESRALAKSIQTHLFRNIKRHNKKVVSWGIKTAPFMVLLGADVPSVLSEVSCISNPDEEQRLATKEYRETIAEYLEEGILDYLSKIEKEEEKPIEGVLRYAASENE